MTKYKISCVLLTPPDTLYLRILTKKTTATISWPEVTTLHHTVRCHQRMVLSYRAMKSNKKRESWNSSDDCFAIFTNIPRPPAHMLTRATTDIYLHIPGYSFVQGILLCAAYYSVRYTTLRSILLCVAYYSARHTTLRGILLCAVYNSAQHTTLRSILLCVAYYSARHTTLRGIQLCAAYYSARYTTLRGILLCTAYYSAWHTTLRGILLCVAYIFLVRQ